MILIMSPKHCIFKFKSPGYRSKRKRLLRLVEDGESGGEDNSNKTALKLGEAIRNGDTDEVNKFLCENGISETLRLKFSFEIMAQRGEVYREDEGLDLPPAMEAVGIRVTSLQLAVLCRQSQLLELLLSSATSSVGMGELNDVLSTR